MSTIKRRIQGHFYIDPIISLQNAIKKELAKGCKARRNHENYSDEGGDKRRWGVVDEKGKRTGMLKMH